MFGIGLGELIIILIVVLIVFGPERLPEIARSLGKAGAEFKKATNLFHKEFYDSIYPPPEGSDTLNPSLKDKETQQKKTEGNSE